MNCKLCYKEIKEEVRSHIFTESLIRLALNDEGVTKRVDKEVIYDVSGNKIGLSYFGSSILPERFKEITGREIKDEDIEGNINPIINTELVCHQCEKLFNPIETEFIQNVYSKIIKRKNEDLKEDRCEFVSFNDMGVLGQLFVIINIWRASASRYENWNLESDEEEIIRAYLNTVLDGTLEGTIAKANSNIEMIKNFHFALNYFIQGDSIHSSNVVFIDLPRNPYLIMLNRLMITFDFNPISSDKLPPRIVGLVEKNIDCIVNSNNTELRIGINSDEKRVAFFDRIVNEIKQDFFNYINSGFINLFQFAFNRLPNKIEGEYYEKKMKDFFQKHETIELSKIQEEIEKVVTALYFGYSN